jgi:hypothetical protein
MPEAESHPRCSASLCPGYVTAVCAACKVCVHWMLMCEAGINSCSRLLRVGGASAFILAKGGRYCARLRPPRADRFGASVAHQRSYFGVFNSIFQMCGQPSSPATCKHPNCMHCTARNPAFGSGLCAVSNQPCSLARIARLQVRAVCPAQNSCCCRRAHQQVRQPHIPHVSCKPQRACCCRELGALLRLNACACVCVRADRPSTAAAHEYRRRADALAQCVAAYGHIPAMPAASYLPVRATCSK